MRPTLNTDLFSSLWTYAGILSANAGKESWENPTVTGTPAADSTKTTLKKVTAFKAKALKKALKLTWKKAAGASGYEIQYSLNKNFKKAKKITIKKASVKTRTIKGLKKNKKKSKA